MARYTKHNSNFIKTTKHQTLKDGSSIYERDWVTIGSQLHFGSGKVPYYNNGNFVFTRSPLPNYQKKHKNGTIVGTWTYEDVQNATSSINTIKNDEHTEDIRTYVYYGSCVELVRSSVENIITTFPGNIKVGNRELYVLKDIIPFTCYEEESPKEYELLKDYYVLDNPFDINLHLKDVVLTQYDNEMRYLSYSWSNYNLSRDGGTTFEPITSYNVQVRSLYEKNSEPCIESIKNNVGSVSFSASEIKKINEGSPLIKTIKNLPRGEYFFEINDNGNIIYKNKWGGNLCYNMEDEPIYDSEAKKDYVPIDTAICTKDKKVTIKAGDYTVLENYQIQGKDITIIFYQTVKRVNVYKYYQMFTNEEYQQIYKAEGWTKSNCRMYNWLPNTTFVNRCDDVQDEVLYSEISGIGKNLPVYTVVINDDIEIEGYIFDSEIVALIKKKDIVIQPKEEKITEYFNSLEGFEKQLLIRKTTPLYSNMFTTPIEYDLGYVYNKRTYTWPSNGYCIDITSIAYEDFLNKLTDTAELLDELWTDNLWKRMTHEAIKNYDWTYTKEFAEGDEEDNVEGGERMHKVLNVMARTFDDVKRNIDLIKKNNTITYNADRNIPNALLSDKLELLGWNVHSTIPTYLDEESQKEIPANTVNIDDDFLSNNNIKWYGTKNNSQYTFEDIDIDFMRKLLLSSKYVLKTKGTRTAIDMVMGMFGYGCCDYEITEEYRTATPIPYDYSETAAEDSFGEKIIQLNKRKQNTILYDDEVSGIPVGSFSIENPIDETTIQHTTYLIPYYNQTKIYDGDFTFQSKGGWGYNKNDDSTELNPYGWTETLSYLRVASTIDDMLDVEPNSVSNDDIFYVVNINDFSSYTETDTLFSNFFVLTNELCTDSFSCWKNIDLTGNTYTLENGYTEEEIKTFKNYAKKANYLNNIIPDNTGNNPHVGYGYYDNGENYFEYLKQPFKYAIDKRYFDDDDEVEAKKIKFGYVEDGEFSLDNLQDFKKTKTVDWAVKLGICSNDAAIYEEKIKVFARKIIRKELEIGSETKGVSPQEFDGFEKTGGKYSYKKDGKYYLSYKEYETEDINNMMKSTYYLNSKIIYMKNKIDNAFYKSYFKSVIMKYLMQVIPSTAILVLENYE